MKKFLSVLLALFAVTSLCSCEKKENEELKYTLLADFSEGESDAFYAADGWSNDVPFNCVWKRANCKTENGIMKMIIDKTLDGSFSGAEYRTKEMYGYGFYEVSMKPIKNDGVVSSFLNYTGPAEGDPWDEVDIEFLGKDTTKVQFNYYTNGAGDHDYLYDLGFDASEDFHTYGYRWTSESITWYVDGEEVYTVTENIPTTPGRIMITAWNGIGVDSWIGAFDGNTPLAAEYQWVRFTAE